MTLPVFFPHPRYVKSLPRDGALPLADVCALAGVPCAALGAWTQRPILMTVLADGDAQDGAQPWIQLEPGDWGAVALGIPAKRATPAARAQWALGALAYVLFDGVARVSIAGAAWARAEAPRGAVPAAQRPLTNAERQRRLRRRALTPALSREERE